MRIQDLEVPPEREDLIDGMDHEEYFRARFPRIPPIPGFTPHSATYDAWERDRRARHRQLNRLPTDATRDVEGEVEEAKEIIVTDEGSGRTGRVKLSQGRHLGWVEGD